MLQGSEIIIILLLALVVLGPHRLPEIARKLGAWSAELRKAASDLRAGLEAEVGDLRTIGDDLKAPVETLRGEIKSVGKELEETNAEVSRLGWVGPDPVSGPKASDALEDLDKIEAVTPPGGGTSADTGTDTDTDSGTTDLEKPTDEEVAEA